MIQSNQFYSGTSGLVIPMPKYAFPPEFQDKSRLTYYASLLNSLEVNSSFYKLPQKVTMRKWAESVPDHFRFTFKLWKEITHNKGLVFDPENIVRFMQVIAEVGSKKGSLLVQFPPSIKADQLQQMRVLLDTLYQINQDFNWPVAVEFRDRSWYRDTTYKLIDSYNFTVVLHDKAASNAPMEELTADFVYLRFHGPEGDYRGSYDDELLYEYAQYAKEWIAAGKTVYVYFNNTMGAALENLRTFNGMVSG